MPPTRASTGPRASRIAGGPATQDLKFDQPACGRQLCLEVVDSVDGQPHAAIGELALLGLDGKPMNQSTWTIAYAGSGEIHKEAGSALNAINGQASDYWHTAYRKGLLRGRRA